MATFVVIGTIFLVVVVAISPALSVTRSMIANFRGVTDAALARGAQQSAIRTTAKRQVRQAPRSDGRKRNAACGTKVRSGTRRRSPAGAGR
jgi:hypothetical protein